ncbi:uncharacterized protein LOC120651490 isoform X2 [Panicum virgatum]|uniref:uncharacterized protein LOC120651490 isoform X2 n=1 Tax=Panicum virgatum TaxID=38727 RepID=UPI0019D53391|nr:uncharacterized protein LOC120651490 isoform X2 [Panicum virgatum]
MAAAVAAQQPPLAREGSTVAAACCDQGARRPCTPGTRELLVAVSSSVCLVRIRRGILPPYTCSLFSVAPARSLRVRLLGLTPWDCCKFRLASGHCHGYLDSGLGSLDHFLSLLGTFTMPFATLAGLEPRDRFATICVKVVRKWEYRDLLMMEPFFILTLYLPTKRLVK